MALRPLLASEHAQIRTLLGAAALPVEDLDHAAVHFIVAPEHGEVVGAIGLEAFGTVGLLRSLVVRPDARDTGLGSQLVDALEMHARLRGLTQLVLLTQTAASFFARRGYHVIDRQAAPEPVMASAEFRSICPASATCMTKHLT